MVSYICNGLLYVTSGKKTKMKTNQPTIALSGGFDPPTKGQVGMIQEAAQIGDVIIILNSDDWCASKRWNGKNFLPFSKRKSILLEIPGVVLVVAAEDEDGTVCKTLKKLKPDFFGNGGNRNIENTPEVEVCKKMGIGMLFFLGKNHTPTSEEILGQAISLSKENSSDRTK
jgi:D-beta-D-heptose 7-phosphate kinase/D-beta-D-heptose 1-phosphate adenosyltransferase